MFSLRFALFLLILPAMPGLVRAQSTQSANVRLAASAGYDNDVLGRPGDVQSLASIGGEGFLQLSPSIEAAARRGPWFLNGAYRYTFNGYGSEAAGLYHDHLGWLSLRYSADPRLAVVFDGTAERFRRTEYKDSDIDDFDGAARLEYAVYRGWTAETSFRAGWSLFPERVVGRYLETDTATEFGAGLTRDLGAGRGLRGLAARLVNTSNAPTSRYAGWRGQVAGQATAWRLIDLAVRLTYEKRNYDENPLVTTGQAGATRRRDHFTQLSLTVGRQLGPRLRSFARMSHLDYRSTVDDYSFSEATASAGLELTLGRPAQASQAWGVGVLAAPPPDSAGVDLSPRLSGREVRFRHRAPGAKEVAVIGSFNGWRPPGLAMTDRGDGVWEVTIVLPPGLHHYMFLVDGTVWQRPEQAPLYEADGFGFDNGVLEIRK